MSRRWKQPVAHSKALPCQFLADEAPAARPSATQRRPHSARAATARIARRSRRRERREEVLALQHLTPLLFHIAQQMDVQLGDSQSSAASIPNVREDDNRSVHSCDTSWVSCKSLNIPQSKHCIAGSSCPRPGHIVHGEWTCEKQQVPIPDTVDLSGNLETYPGS